MKAPIAARCAGLSDYSHCTHPQLALMGYRYDRQLRWLNDLETVETPETVLSTVCTAELDDFRPW